MRACASGAYGGLAETLVKAAVGNGLGITVDEDIDMGPLFEPAYGTFVIELAAGEDCLLYTSKDQRRRQGKGHERGEEQQERSQVVPDNAQVVGGESLPHSPCP